MGCTKIIYILDSSGNEQGAEYQTFQTLSFLGVGPEQSIISNICTQCQGQTPLFSETVPEFSCIVEHTQSYRDFPKLNDKIMSTHENSKSILYTSSSNYLIIKLLIQGTTNI